MKRKNIKGAVAAYISSGKLQAIAGLVICVRGITDPYSEIDSMPAAEQAVLRPVLNMILEAGLREKVDFLDIRSQAELASTYRPFGATRSSRRGYTPDDRLSFGQNDWPIVNSKRIGLS